MKELAARLDVALSGIRGKNNMIKAILDNASEAELSIALDISSDHEPENTGISGAEELADIGRELENSVDELEKMPSAENADIQYIDEMLDNNTQLSVDYSPVGLKLDLGRVKYHDKRFMDALNELAVARENYEIFHANLTESLHSFIILAAEHVFDDCVDAQCNDEKAAAVLLEAKRAFLDKGARRREAVDRLIEVTNEIYKEQIAYIRDRMQELEASINTMKIQGVDVFNSERYIHRSKEAFSNGELSLTGEYLDKAKTLAEESRSDWIRRIEENLPRVKQVIQMANDLGADVSEAEKFLGQATMSLENKDYALCAELTKVCERKAMESQQSQIQKAAQLERRQLAEAQEILTQIEPALQEARLYGMDTRRVNDTIHNARIALQSNDYVNAKIYARDAENLMRTLAPQLEAERARLLKSSNDLTVCHNCGHPTVKSFNNGWARCLTCGMMSETKKQDKKLFGGLFNK